MYIYLADKLAESIIALLPGRNSVVSILCIGEILWDRFESHTETLAGAPFNVAVALNRLQNSVALVSSLGRDARGTRALHQIHALGLNAKFLKIHNHLPTGTAEIHFDAQNNPSYSIPRPAAFDALALNEEDIQAISALHPQWMYFGTLTQTSRDNEELIAALTRRLPGVACFYDLNLRHGHWNFPLVQKLARQATVLKLNRDEAQELFAFESTAPFSLDAFCGDWSSRYRLAILCITLGSEGCAVFSQGKMLRVPGFPVTVADTVGAGDAFTAGFLHGLMRQWPLAQTTRFANALGSIVASRPTAIPDWTPADVQALLHTPHPA